MQIVIDDNQTCYVVSKHEKMLLQDFCKRARTEQGLTLADVELRSGLNHPMYYNFEKGITKSPINGLIALQTLGYTIFTLGRIYNANA